MTRIALFTVLLGLSALSASATAQTDRGSEQWKIYVTNDNCPDYTWGLTEEETRQAFADVVKGHLDEMTRTDAEQPENRDRYNMAVTQEALCFVERYPEREQELVRRIQEGRAYVSPYLCNSLWAFQSAEGMIRTFYPYRRLERRWGISTDCAHHIELPSLPWGVPTILAGCGFRALSVPFLKYDSQFENLDVPPLFFHQGPDGSRIKVVLDRWASLKGSYSQGATMLQKPATIQDEWLPHYTGLGEVYPLRAILACGTHNDIKPNSGAQARGFAQGIIRYNARPEAPAQLINATYPQFWQMVDRAEVDRPFLSTVRGSFGHTWDLWPVCLAKYAADSREGERRFLAAETLLAVASHGQTDCVAEAREELQRAEWCWSMLSDHAWNGTGEANKRLNADLRRGWSEELLRLSQATLERGWSAAGLTPSPDHVSLFNSLSLPRQGLVRIPAPANVTFVIADGRQLPSQTVQEEDQNWLYFVTPLLEGFQGKTLEVATVAKAQSPPGTLVATPTQLESPFYRLVVDPQSGGITSLIHKTSGVELVTPNQPRTLCQTVYFDGQEHVLADTVCEPVTSGDVLARLQIRSGKGDLRVTNSVTVYADLDRVDFDVRVHKSPTDKQERLCQAFPLLDKKAVLRAATAGAVVRPRLRPEGDLLPGADLRRFAVREFVNLATEDMSVTLVSLDAFALRLDLDTLAFEALGNDQNYREVLRDQNGVTTFRFRYSLQARAGGYGGAEAVAFGLSAATPPLCARGRLEETRTVRPLIAIDATRAVATCLKPADDPATGGQIIRLWEIAGRSGPTKVRVSDCRGAFVTDLLERGGEELTLEGGMITVNLKAHGYSSVRVMK